MPEHLQHIAGTGYAFVEPRLTWARSKSQLLNGTVARLESIATPALQVSDEHLDMVCSAACKRTTGALSLLHDGSLRMVDRSEALIDRLLPLPTKLDKTAGEKSEKKDASALVLRIARLPFRMPVRVTMVMYMKANGAVDYVLVSGREIVRISKERQAQLAQMMSHRAKLALCHGKDKLTAVSKSATNAMQPYRNSASKRMAALRCSMADGTEIIMVKIKVIFERLRITQAKDWSSEKVGGVKQATLSVAKGVTQRAHGATARIAGEKRAAVVFTRLPALLTGGFVEVKAPSANGKEAASGPAPLAVARPIAG
jgi:hypothetical protein